MSSNCVDVCWLLCCLGDITSCWQMLFTILCRWHQTVLTDVGYYIVHVASHYVDRCWLLCCLSDSTLCWQMLVTTLSRWHRIVLTDAGYYDHCLGDMTLCNVEAECVGNTDSHGDYPIQIYRVTETSNKCERFMLTSRSRHGQYGQMCAIPIHRMWHITSWTMRTTGNNYTVTTLHVASSERQHGLYGSL